MGINHALMDWVNQVEISAQRNQNRNRTDRSFLLSPNNLVALRLEVINLNEGKLLTCTEVDALKEMQAPIGSIWS